MRIKRDAVSFALVIHKRQCGRKTNAYRFSQLMRMGKCYVVYFLSFHKTIIHFKNKIQMKKLKIEATPSAGVGTTKPANSLEVLSIKTTAGIIETMSQEQYVRFNNGLSKNTIQINLGGAVDIGGCGMIITSDDTIHVGPNAIGNSEPMEKLRIDANGKHIWPGITNPTAKLEVKDGYDTIFFSHDKDLKEVLKLCPNGDIFVHGKLITNEIQVVEALKEFLTSQGFSF